MLDTSASMATGARLFIFSIHVSKLSSVSQLASFFANTERVDSSSGINIFVSFPTFSSTSNSNSRLGMVGRKNGADLGTVSGVFGLFRRLTTSKLSRFNHLEVGWSDRVISSRLICSGDLYSGSSPRSMAAMSSISGFSLAVLGSAENIQFMISNFLASSSHHAKRRDKL